MPDAEAPLLVSIVVSTYRRPDMLVDALKSMRGLAVRDGLRYEVLVIDNDPSGSARATVESFENPWPAWGALRYVCEPQSGLSYVRNRGLDEAAGQIVAFLDDDIFIDPDWLLQIVDCFARTGADCVGGRTSVCWGGDPEFPLQACEERFMGLDRGSIEFEVRGPWLPGGGNLAVRRSLVPEGFRFQHGLGRVGSMLLSGEDTEVIRRMLKAGKRIWYCGTAVMRHRTGGERLKAAYYLRRAYWIGLSYALVDRRLHGKAYQVASALARLARATVAAPPAWLLASIRRDEAATFLLRASLARQAGYLFATFRPYKILPQTT